MKQFFLILFLGLGFFPTRAQAPRTWNSAEILLNLKKLNVLGSVLYIAAHPDDENTRLLAWLANEKSYRTAYLSLTRGDGGQNLIGDEQGVGAGPHPHPGTAFSPQDRRRRTVFFNGL